MPAAGCFKFIEQLATCKTTQNIKQVCESFCDNFGYDHYFYGVLIPTSFTKPSIYILSNQPDEWRTRYSEMGYLSIDPTASYCMEHIVPVHWTDIHNPEPALPGAIKMFREALDFGIADGISFPIHTIRHETAMLSLSGGKPDADWNKRLITYTPECHLFATYLHEAVLRILPDIRQAVSAILTEREKECLLWTAEGKTSWEISQILNISERTVVFHLKNATQKLDVVNRQHAVAKAISHGYILPCI